MIDQMETYYGLRLQVESMRKLYESARDGMRQLGSELESTRIRIAELEAALEEAREDSDRLDWLDQFIQCGCADFGFELDGGVYLQLNSPGAETVNIREANDARAAIDAARKEQP